MSGPMLFTHSQTWKLIWFYREVCFVFFGVCHGISTMGSLILERKCWHGYIWLSSGCSSKSRGFFLVFTPGTTKLWAIKLGYLTIRVNSKLDIKSMIKFVCDAHDSVSVDSTNDGKFSGCSDFIEKTTSWDRGLKNEVMGLMAWFFSVKCFEFFSLNFPILVLGLIL